MPRQPVIECPDSFFHITNRCINKEWFIQSMDDVWEIFCLHLNYCIITFEIEVLSFALMMNHYHMICRFPQMNKSETMHHFSKEVGRDLRLPSHRINKTFGGRYSASQIPHNIETLRTVYKYVYANPVKAGITTNAETYRYSTLGGLIGNHPLDIKIIPDFIFPEKEISQHLNWINTLPNDELWRKTSFHLNRGIFRPAKDPKTRKPIIL